MVSAEQERVEEVVEVLWWGGAVIMEWRGGVGGYVGVQGCWGVSWWGGAVVEGCRCYGGVELLRWGRGVVEGWKCYGRVEVLRWGDGEVLK